MTEADRVALERAAQGGLCARCSRARLVTSSRGSVFVMCTHPDLPKYPRLPVLRCDGFASGTAIPEPETPS